MKGFGETILARLVDPQWSLDQSFDWLSAQREETEEKLKCVGAERTQGTVLARLADPPRGCDRSSDLLHARRKSVSGKSE